MSARGPTPPFHVVLLAGGGGTRFWPLSRAGRPKQLLPLAGARPLVVESWRRARRLAPAERIWVVAPAALAPELRRLLPELGAERLVLEPSPRDTAPAVTLACLAVAQAAPGAVAGIFPTDHVIRDERAFARSVGVAARAATARGALVCLGIRPDRAATGFGYLRCAEPPRPGRSTRVDRFVEKPDAGRARRFVRSGRYLWNAGMFVWVVERFLAEVGRSAPEILRAAEGQLAGRPRAWSRAPRLSVDYAVMERAQGVEVVPLAAGWDDLGSWDAASRLRAERAPAGRDRLLVASPGSVVFGEGRFVAVVGVPGIAVVDTPDALLVVARQESEVVKQVVQELRRRKRDDLL